MAKARKSSQRQPGVPRSPATLRELAPTGSKRSPAIPKWAFLTMPTASAPSLPSPTTPPGPANGKCHRTRRPCRPDDMTATQIAQIGARTRLSALVGETSAVVLVLVVRAGSFREPGGQCVSFMRRRVIPQWPRPRLAGDRGNSGKVSAGVGQGSCRTALDCAGRYLRGAVWLGAARCRGLSPQA